MNDPFNPDAVATPEDPSSWAPEHPDNSAHVGHDEGVGTADAAAAFHALADELDATTAQTAADGTFGEPVATEVLDPSRADKVAPVLLAPAAKTSAADRKAAKQAAKQAAKAAKADSLPTAAAAGGLAGAPIEDAAAAKKAAKAAKKEAKLAAAHAAAGTSGKDAKEKSGYTPAERPGPWIDPVKPSALLLPSYIVDRHAAAKTARAMRTITVVVVVLLVAASAFFFWSGQQAAKRAESAAAEKAQAQAAVSQLTGISEYFDGIVERKDAVASQMRDELDYSAILGELTRLAGNKVRVSAATLQTQPPCQGPNPFEAKPALGCMSITVSAANEQAVFDFVDNINVAGKLINSAYAGATGGTTAGSATPPTVSEGEGAKGGGAQVNVTFNYVAEALSLRHVPEDQKQQVLSEAIARSVLPPGTLGTATTTTPTTPVTPPAPTTGATQ